MRPMLRKPGGPAASRGALLTRYRDVRRRTEALAAPLSAEDAMVQSMPEASPTKWHLAHTTWFFAEFLLTRFDPAHRWPDERWRVLFNSYYEASGPRHPRPHRGALSRPGLDAIRSWRASIDERVRRLLSSRADDAALAIVRLGTHHEEQHQELLLTDALHALSCNPLDPAYAPRPAASRPPADVRELTFVPFEEIVAEVGHEGTSFAFDNETPRHRALVGSFEMGSRLVTNAEYAAFVADGGYRQPALWLSDGWTAVQSGGWSAPLYWRGGPDEWTGYGLRGLLPLDPGDPVANVSLYEADAYARWAGARLPTEIEWERAAAVRPVEGNFLESGALSPRSAGGESPAQLFGDVWEWTGSAYLPYPRFRPLAGALGEYNGKFMSGQMVLRGGSCLSPRDHLRASYRNYFPPAARWQMTGIRLARDA
jgi:ergothioneine biosynthesis protein EgtB